MKKIRLGDIICNAFGDFTDPFDVPADVNYLEVANGWWFRARSAFADDIASDTTIKTLIGDYVIPSLYDMTIALVDDWDTEETEAAIKERTYRSILSWLKRTREVHKKIIEASNVELMKSVENVTKTYFNDTPQSPNPDLDNHTTNYTKNVNTSDLGTPASRIDEIRRLYENEFQNWYNEFFQSFIMLL